MTPEDVAARRHALELDEDGWAGTILVEPLSALAGGILGGVLVGAVGWRLAWRQQRPPLFIRVRQLRAAARRAAAVVGRT